MISSHQQSIVITIPAVTSSLCEVRTAIREHLQMAGVTELTTDQVVLAVDEACSNLVVHAVHDESSAAIRVHLSISDSILCVDIEDTAAPFRPDSVERPCMEEYFAEYRHHGLGILLIYTVMDLVEYIPKTGASTANHLILTKRLSR